MSTFTAAGMRGREGKELFRLGAEKATSSDNKQLSLPRLRRDSVSRRPWKGGQTSRSPENHTRRCEQKTATVLREVVCRVASPAIMTAAPQPAYSWFEGARAAHVINILVSMRIKDHPTGVIQTKLAFICGFSPTPPPPPGRAWPVSWNPPHSGMHSMVYLYFCPRKGRNFLRNNSDKSELSNKLSTSCAIQLSGKITKATWNSIQFLQVVFLCQSQYKTNYYPEISSLF